MPSTMIHEPGDVVLVAFSFTDQINSKKRPAVAISSREYNNQRQDLVIMAITSRIRTNPDFQETPINHWQDAGLLKPSVIEPVMATIEKRLIQQGLGRLNEADHRVLGNRLRMILQLD